MTRQRCLLPFRMCLNAPKKKVGEGGWVMKLVVYTLYLKPSKTYAASCLDSWLRFSAAFYSMTWHMWEGMLEQACFHSETYYDKQTNNNKQWQSEQKAVTTKMQTWQQAVTITKNKQWQQQQINSKQQPQINGKKKEQKKATINNNRTVNNNQGTNSEQQYTKSKKQLATNNKNQQKTNSTPQSRNKQWVTIDKQTVNNKQ